MADAPAVLLVPYSSMLCDQVQQQRFPVLGICRVFHRGVFSKREESFKLV